MLSSLTGFKRFGLKSKIFKPRNNRGFFLTFEDWKKYIEKRLHKYFPKRWNKDNILFFLERNSYSLDVKAINNNLREPIEDFIMRGGKRIRPLLFLTTLDILGKKPLEYLDIAIVIELVHNGTLVLDDIEDRATLRRGKPTLHKKYGLDTATNAGASLHLLPLRLIEKNRSKLSAKTKNRLWNVYADEVINVSFGQGLDIYWHKNDPNDVLINKYLEMVRLKTGSLMRMSVRMACAIAGTDKNVERLFSDYAESLGIAFQIIDDSLDLSPPDEKFGKSFGNDITEGKISLPIIFALKHADKKAKKRLLYILSKHTKNKKLIFEAIEIIEKTDAIKDAKSIAKEILDNAWQNLEANFKKNGNLKRMEELSNFVLYRKF